MKTQIRVLITGLLFLSVTQVKSSIVIPFRNLGELTQAADKVIYVESLGSQFDVVGIEKHEYFPVKVIISVKSGDQQGEIVKIKSYHIRVNNMETKIWGDIKMEENHKYLVFLKESNSTGVYQAIGLSYYVFEEKIIDGLAYFVPCEESKQIHLTERPDGNPTEPLYKYKRDALLDYLKQFAVIGGNWDGRKAMSDQKEEKKIEEIQLRTLPPSYCTFLAGVSPPWSRWTGFTSIPLPVKYNTGADTECSFTFSSPTGAVTALNAAYPGISLMNDGTFSGYVPTCSGGAAGGNFTSFCDGLSGGSRNVLIMYNDPCSEIPDLVSCAGTLAVGGSYNTIGNTHMYQGIEWEQNLYGYVIVNNGLGPTCLCNSNYTIMMEHEITHTLGIGHIAPSNGSANMNPSCCNTISSLDVSCLEYSYSSSLPIELSSFKGELNGDQIELSWSSSSEKDNEKYILEYSNDAKQFNTIYSVAGAGNSYTSKTYNYRVKANDGINYFRLAQKDFNDNIVYVGDIVAIPYGSTYSFDLSSHMINAKQLLINYNSNTETDLLFQLINSMGQTVYTSNIKTPKGPQNYIIELPDLAVGWYNLHCIEANKVYNTSFVLSK